MSREIKFRAWDKEAKEYYYDAEYTYDFRCGSRGCYADSFGDVLTQSERYEVEQYTGLKDKNGKEIYEGDIIKETIDDGSNKTIQMYEVYWDIDTLCWSIKGVNGFDYNLHDDLWQTNSSREVIGNIHENPELIKDDTMGN